MEKLIEPNPEYIPLPRPEPEELQQWEEDNRTPLYRLIGNRKQRRALLRAGILGHVSEEIWVAAGYTYLQQLAKAVPKNKPQKVDTELWNWLVGNSGGQ